MRENAIRKVRKRITGLRVCALAMLAVICTTVPAFATETTGAADDDVPFAEFTNDSNDTPDLFIKKTLVSAVPDIAPPADAEFHFAVKVGGEWYSDQVYELYDSNGKQIHNKYDIDSDSYTETTDEKAPGIEAPFTTDGNGGFYMKAGRTAKFPWVGTGVDFEVYEELEEDGQFVQTYPAGGGPQVGHIEASGSSVEFENTWYPETHSEYTELRVAKKVMLPDGFAIPDTPDFEFILKIAYKPYAGQPYDIEDTEGNVIGSDVTDAEGRFKLKGGQTAVFRELETGKDYEVSEVSGADEATGSEADAAETADGETAPDAWRQVSATGEAGATKPPVTYAEFTNAIADFAVTKRMEGYSLPDASFRFFLTDQAGTPMAGTQYYLYDADRNLTDTEPKTTGDDGSFELKAGETALFIGLETGTEYAVREEAKEGYLQTFPEKNAGYSAAVRDDTVPVHEFVNAADTDARLTIRKQGTDGEILAGAKFRVRRGRANSLSIAYADFSEDGDAWRFSGWKLVGGTEIETNESGEFVIEGLEEGTYTLVETEPPAGYFTMDPVTFTVTYDDANGARYADIALTQDPAEELREDAVMSGSVKDGTGVLMLSDEPAIPLPETGGPGTFGRTLLMLAVTGAGLALLEFGTRRRSV